MAAGTAASTARPPSPGFAALIPRPLAEAPERGAFALSRSTRIVVRDGSPEGARVARLLAGALRPATGYALPVTRAQRARGGIVLSLAPGDRSLGDEGYRVRVEPHEVSLVARRPAGLFYATQTLRQLLPASIEASGRQPGPWLVPLGTIHDLPRFAWRGLMLDVARHFFGVGEVNWREAGKKDYRFSEIVWQVVASEPFRMRVVPEPAAPANATPVVARAAAQ